MDMYGLVLFLAIQKCNKNEPYIKGRRDRYIFRNETKILGVSNRPITNSGGVEPPKTQLWGGVEHRYFGHLSEFLIKIEIPWLFREYDVGQAIFEILAPP